MGHVVDHVGEAHERVLGVRLEARAVGPGEHDQQRPAKLGAPAALVLLRGRAPDAAEQVCLCTNSVRIDLSAAAAKSAFPEKPTDLRFRA